MVGKTPVLILVGLRATLQAIRVVGGRGKVQRRGVMEVIRLISEIEDGCGEKSVSLA